MRQNNNFFERGKNPMKKIIAVLLASMMAATALVGCGGNGDTSSQASGTSSQGSNATPGSDSAAFGDEDNIKLKVWAPDKAVKTFEAQCEAFKALYPDKTIEIEVVAQSESDAAAQVLNDATVAADVFGFASDQLNKLVDAGVIAQAAFTDEIKANNTAESVVAATMNDTIYAYPETGDNGYYLVYDNTVITAEQAGSFEATLEACKTANKKFIMDAGNGFYSCVFAFTGGLKIDGFEEVDGIPTQKFAEYDEAEVVATLQAFSKLMHDYKGTFQALSTDSISSGFAAGTCGAGIDGSWNTVTNQEALGDKFGAAKLPTIEVNGEAKQMVSMLGYKFLGVNGSTKFPRAAQILAHYLTGEECQRQRATDLGWGPSNTVVNGEAVVTESAVLTAIAEQGKFAVAQTNVAATFWDPMANLGNKLIADDTDPSNAEFFKKLVNDTINNIKDL
jgi:arabinogalactan oligomer/maltooligosaccharide transport system substrate-binding protein